jgi:hypothetical protein
LLYIWKDWISMKVVYKTCSYLALSVTKSLSFFVCMATPDPLHWLSSFLWIICNNKMMIYKKSIFDRCLRRFFALVFVQYMMICEQENVYAIKSDFISWMINDLIWILIWFIPSSLYHRERKGQFEVKLWGKKLL